MSKPEKPFLPKFSSFITYLNYEGKDKFVCSAIKQEIWKHTAEGRFLNGRTLEAGILPKNCQKNNHFQCPNLGVGIY